MRVVFVALLATIMVSTACGTSKWGFPSLPQLTSGLPRKIRTPVVADSTVETLESTVADDVELTNRERSTIGDHPALDFRLSFTDPSGKRNIKFSRYIGDGTRAVLLQSALSVAAENEATAAPIVEKYHRQLADNVRLA